MSKIDEYRQKLDEIKKINKSEIEFHEIKRWMIKDLGVREIETGKGSGKKKGKGSNRTFYHPAFLQLNPEGYFTIHVLHKKKEMIRRLDFKNYLSKKLEYIIDYLAGLEAEGGAE